MEKRTYIDFEYPNTLWPLVDQWAKDNKFRLITSNETTRRYQRGHGFWTAPMMIEINQNQNQYKLQAWIPCNLLVRIASLFILPSEMGIRSGGFRSVLPRRIARNAVNKLLASLNLAAIP
ncbi:MAG: hypothetical protein H7A32_05585 [Deltaproteobacteria bacterium]|nr:hypothetical protein [Deltaproteobacteria bacterium]